jgi:transcriptional regulator with XRE-family HTH domain
VGLRPGTVQRQEVAGNARHLVPEYRFMVARLRQARGEAGLTQAEVGRRLGVRQNFVSRAETGERRLDVVDLARFAAIYGKPLEWFLG